MSIERLTWIFVILEILILILVYKIKGYKPYVLEEFEESSLPVKYLYVKSIGSLYIGSIFDVIGFIFMGYCLYGSIAYLLYFICNFLGKLNIPDIYLVIATFIIRIDYDLIALHFKVRNLKQNEEI